MLTRRRRIARRYEPVEPSTQDSSSSSDEDLVRPVRLHLTEKEPFTSSSSDEDTDLSGATDDGDDSTESTDEGICCKRSRKDPFGSSSEEESNSSTPSIPDQEEPSSDEEILNLPRRLSGNPLNSPDDDDEDEVVPADVPSSDEEIILPRRLSAAEDPLRSSDEDADGDTSSDTASVMSSACANGHYQQQFWLHASKRYLYDSSGEESDASSGDGDQLWRAKVVSGPAVDCERHRLYSLRRLEAAREQSKRRKMASASSSDVEDHDVVDQPSDFDQDSASSTGSSSDDEDHVGSESSDVDQDSSSSQQSLLDEANTSSDDERSYWPPVVFEDISLSNEPLEQETRVDFRLLREALERRKQLNLRSNEERELLEEEENSSRDVVQFGTPARNSSSVVEPVGPRKVVPTMTSHLQTPSPSSALARDVQQSGSAEYSGAARRLDYAQSLPQTHQQHAGLQLTPDGFTVCHAHGSCMAMPRAGYGVYFGRKHPLNVSKPAPRGRQTLFRAEILAIIAALTTAKDAGIKKLEVRTDSSFVVSFMTNWFPHCERNQWRMSVGVEVSFADEFRHLARLRKIVELRNVLTPKAGVGNSVALALARQGARKRRT